MSEIEFKPKHNWFSIIFVSLMIITLGGVALLIGYTNNKVLFLIFGLALLLLGLYSVARRSTLIIIGVTEVVMKRVLMPDLVLEYDAFTDFIGNAFLFGNTGIPLDDMTNAQEFIKLFSPILEKKNIQSKGKYVADLNRTNKAMRLAPIPAAIVSIIVMYALNPYLDKYDAELIAGIIFIVILFGVYFILKKVEEFKKE